MRHNFISIVLLQQWRRVAVTPARSQYSKAGKIGYCACGTVLNTFAT